MGVVEKALDIKPRRMDFIFPSNLPRFWFNNDPFVTHLYNALSTTFPEGEKFFVDAVRFYRDDITDPTLKKQISGFIGQEAFHSKEHIEFNAWLQSQGYNIDKYYAQVKRRTDLGRERGTPILKLAVTCALEHFTAIMADQMLSNPEFKKGVHPDVLKLWMWHAIEETEHKGVAFDVFKAVGGNYRIRVVSMFFVTLNFIYQVMRIHIGFLQEDGKLFDVKMWMKGIWYFWGKPGWFRKLIPAWLEYFRPDFHPWQQDNQHFIEEWKRTEVNN